MTDHQQPDPQAEALERLLEVAGEADARRIVAETGRPAAAQELERVIARNAAGRLLQEQVPRDVIRERLVGMGLSLRTAYRVIDAALQRFGSGASKVPALAGATTTPAGAAAPAVVQPPPEPARATTKREPMTTNTERLQRQLDAARAELATIDLEAARARAREAEKTRDELNAKDAVGSAPVYAPGALSVITADSQAIRDASTKASRAAKDARQTVRVLEDRTSALQAEIERLGRMLDSAGAIERGRVAVDQAGERTASAEQRVTEAEATVQRFAELIAQAEHEEAAERTATAAKLLEAVKGGQASPTVPTPVSKVHTLQLAKASAEEELKVTRAALRPVVAEQNAAMGELRRAESAAAELRFELLAPEYLEAMTEHIVAHIRAYRVQPQLPDALAEAHKMAQATLEREP